MNVLTGYPASIQCNYTLFNFAGNTSTPVPGPMPPLASCGYNQDGQFYCPANAGDSPVKSLITQIIPVFRGSNLYCNPASVGFVQGGCVRLIAGYRSQFNNFRELNYLINNITFLWPLIANNAPCTKEAITWEFWMGNFGTGLTSVMASIASIVSLMI